MRKIEEELYTAIRHFRPFSKGNTVFHRKADVNTTAVWELVLHGNPIAMFNEFSKTPEIPTYVSLAGWPTKTTCSRLNCLEGVRVYIRKGVPYLNEHEIDANGWFNP